MTGAVAGIEQANHTFKGYGLGAEGYGMRFGANYADGFDSDLIGGAILPSLFKQDPRYFYKGTGSVRSRVLYAIEAAVICRGDNGHRQFNYSGILGGLAAGGISNLYYPAGDRSGVGVTFEKFGDWNCRRRGAESDSGVCDPPFDATPAGILSDASPLARWSPAEQGGHARPAHLIQSTPPVGSFRLPAVQLTPPA